MVSALGSEPRYLGSIPSTPAKNTIRNLFSGSFFVTRCQCIPLFFNILLSNTGSISFLYKCFLTNSVKIFGPNNGPNGIEKFPVFLIGTKAIQIGMTSFRQSHSLKNR